MTNRVGSSTTYGTILPNSAELGRISNVKLSKEAKQRLAVLDYYFKKSNKNISLTCRHFGVARSYLYKWLRRFNPKDLTSLESRSTRPHRVRQSCYDFNLVSIVRRIRTDYPTYSSKKIAVILFRDFSIKSSHSTIGRIISKFNLYFALKYKQAKRRSAAAIKTWIKRKPYNLKATKPHQVIEFDMKHIYIMSKKLYAFVSVDPITKESLIHVANNPSSFQAQIAMQHTIEYFGSNVTIVNDNGSENFKHTHDYLKDLNITQYFARPRTPKDKPHVENLIGKYQQECLDNHKDKIHSLQDLADYTTNWLNDYHYYRPHQSLNYLTPAEYCDSLNISIPKRFLSTMY